jgi:hypothetical protein
VVNSEQRASKFSLLDIFITVFSVTGLSLGSGATEALPATALLLINISNFCSESPESARNFSLEILIVLFKL